MKNLVLGSVALIVIGMSSAFAADMPVKAPPPPAPAAPYNWSGLYVGGNFGGAWTSGNLKPPAFASVATLNSRRMSVVTGCSNFGRRMMWANLTTNSVHAKVFAALQFDFNQKTIQPE
jgi:opacity protein-like surface antigen